MSSEATKIFTKENLDGYLKELAKEYRKRVGKAMPAEIVLVGGAAVLANYGFRNMTTDVDAVIHAASSMKDAINCVGDKYGLPNGWMNADFMYTSSYTPKLDQFSQYYRTFSNVLTIRTVTAEYLIAMKLRSGRKYKNDMSDIVGILSEHEKRNTPISLDAIERAVKDLYGGWDSIPKDSIDFIRNVMQKGHFTEMFALTAAEEKTTKNTLLDFEQHYPGVTNSENLDSIIRKLKEKENSKAMLPGQGNGQRDQEATGRRYPSKDKLER